MPGDERGLPSPSTNATAASCSQTVNAAQGMLSAQDVWNNASQFGATASLTRLNQSKCGNLSKYLAPQCDQDALWAIPAQQLADLGVATIRKGEMVNVVGSSQSTLDETIIDFYPNQVVGMKSLDGVIKECGGSNSSEVKPTADNGSGIGYAQSTDRIILIESTDKRLWSSYAQILEKASDRAR